MRNFRVYLLGLLAVALTLALASDASAESLPPSVSILGVVGYPQQHNLSCESRSATDTAAYWGGSFTEDEFFRRLPKSDNPHKGFLGDVDLPPGTMPPFGYGVYAGPIAANLRTFGYDAEAHRNWDLESLKAELAAGRPVIVWATYDMRLPGVQTWVSWDGETSLIVQWQHTFIAVGYDEEGVYLIDAYDAETKHPSFESFDAAWAQLERLAVTVDGLAPAGPAPAWELASSASGQRYVVDGRLVTEME